MSTNTVTKNLMVVALGYLIGKILFEVVKLPLEIAIIWPFKAIFGWTFKRVRAALRSDEKKPEATPAPEAEAGKGKKDTDKDKS